MNVVQLPMAICFSSCVRLDFRLVDDTVCFAIARSRGRFHEDAIACHSTQTSQEDFIKMNRRMFLKVSAAVPAVVAASQLPGLALRGASPAEGVHPAARRLAHVRDHHPGRDPCEPATPRGSGCRSLGGQAQHQRPEHFGRQCQRGSLPPPKYGATMLYAEFDAATRPPRSADQPVPNPGPRDRLVAPGAASEDAAELQRWTRPPT